MPGELLEAPALSPEDSGILLLRIVVGTPFTVLILVIIAVVVIAGALAKLAVAIPSVRLREGRDRVGFSEAKDSYALMTDVAMAGCSEK